MTGEQVTVLDTIATFDAVAKAANSVVILSMTFFGGLADMLATNVLSRPSTKAD